jgi:hypothetical protein
MDRKPRKSATYKPDLLVPIDKGQIKLDGTCFGKEWDITTPECKACSDNVVCSILMQHVTVQAKVEEVKKLSNKKHYLDEADFESVDITKILSKGELSEDDLIDEVEALSKCEDFEAVENFIKRYLKANLSKLSIRTVKGIAYIKLKR